MEKGKVGKLLNKQFAYFWLLIGGGIGDLLLVISFPQAWLPFLLSGILSIVIMALAANEKQRPKVWLGVNMLVTFALTLIFFLQNSQINYGFFVPNLLIVFGCIFGIMDW